MEVAAKNNETSISSLYERLKPIIGQVTDAPPDASRNIGHYLYGHPKQCRQSSLTLPSTSRSPAIAVTTMPGRKKLQRKLGAHR